MTPEQEIRAKALEIKLNGVTQLASACITAKRDFDGSKMWIDDDLDEFVAYITNGTKPKKEGP